ncbi:hypothetical protein [Massilia sp. NR 4-1]|uniref:hypothetical protein n=1 Tax=Massilia sp. NR 4-1 TaxID=1678028 RepID=UPI000AD9740F|nr:hypothetical protein [Massilia sp. NR 4-1]
MKFSELSQHDLQAINRRAMEHLKSGEQEHRRGIQGTSTTASQLAKSEVKRFLSTDAEGQITSVRIARIADKASSKIGRDELREAFRIAYKKLDEKK